MLKGIKYIKQLVIFKEMTIAHFANTVFLQFFSILYLNQLIISHKQRYNRCHYVNSNHEINKYVDSESTQILNNIFVYIYSERSCLHLFGKGQEQRFTTFSRNCNYQRFNAYIVLLKFAVFFKLIINL